jgi:PPOX class probable F420-dependent enzyme
MTVKVPQSHRHLLESSVDVILTTVSPEGYPHSSLVWCSFDGKHVLLNTGRGYRKERNMRGNPKVTVFSYNPKDPRRWIEVQGAVELIEEGAIDHLNELSYKYTGKRDFYKDLMPELAGKEVRVVCKVTPTRIRHGG